MSEARLERIVSQAVKDAFDEHHVCVIPTEQRVFLQKMERLGGVIQTTVVTGLVLGVLSFSGGMLWIGFKAAVTVQAATAATVPAGQR